MREYRKQDTQIDIKIGCLRDLLRWIGECVESFQHILSQDLILNTNHSRQKDIVQRLGLHTDIQLLHTKGQTSYQGFHGPNHARQTWLHRTRVFTPFFHNTDFRCRHGEEARKAHCFGFLFVELSNLLLELAFEIIQENKSWFVQEEDVSHLCSTRILYRNHVGSVLMCSYWCRLLASCVQAWISA